MRAWPSHTRRARAPAGWAFFSPRMSTSMPMGNPPPPQSAVELPTIRPSCFQRKRRPRQRENTALINAQQLKVRILRGETRSFGGGKTSRMQYPPKPYLDSIYDAVDSREYSFPSWTTWIGPFMQQQSPHGKCVRSRRRHVFERTSLLTLTDVCFIRRKAGAACAKMPASSTERWTRPPLSLVIEKQRHY